MADLVIQLQRNSLISDEQRQCLTRLPVQHHPDNPAARVMVEQIENVGRRSQDLLALRFTGRQG